MAEILTLLPVVTTAEWTEFHAIRKAELFDARGRGDIYDRDHAGDRAPGNMPMLLRAGNEAIGVLRIDDLGHERAALRLLAIRGNWQRRGYGVKMIELVLTQLREHGYIKVVVNSAPDAVEFYKRFGFREEAWPDNPAATSVQMALSLASQ